MTFQPASKNGATLFPLSKHLTLACLTGVALASLCLPVFASDGVVRNIRYDQGSHHFMIDTSGPVKATVNSLNIAGHKRIIIDVDNAEIGIELPRDVQLLQDMTSQMPEVRNLTVNQYGGNGRPIVRILLDLQGDPGNIRMVRNQGPHIELELNQSAAYQPGGRSLDMPPSLSGLKQQNDQPSQTAQRPLVNPAPSNNNAVPRETYNRTLQAQQEQQRQLAALQREMEQLKSSSANSGIATDDLKRTLAILNQKYETLLQENQYLRSQMNSGNQSQSTAKGEQERLTSEIERLKSSNNSLQSANASLQNKVSSLMSEQSRPDPTLEYKQAEINQLKTENRALQVKLEQQGSQIASSQSASSQSTDALKRQLNDLTRKNDTLARENTTLQNRLSSSQSAKPDPALEAKLDTKQAEIDRLRADKTSLEARLSLLANKSGASTSTTGVSDADLQNMKKQLTLAQQSLNDSIRTINEQNKEIAYLRNQVSDVKAGLDASAREQIAHLQATQDEKDATIRDLQKQLAGKSPASNSNTANTAEIASLKRQLDKITQQYQTDVQDLNRQLLDRNAHLITAQSKASQVDDLQQQVSALQSQLAQNSQKSTAASQGSKVSAAEVQKRDAQIATLKAEITKLQTAKSDATTLSGKVAALQTEISSLQSVQKERDAAQQELASTKSELEQLQGNGANAKKSSASLKEAMDKLTRENQDLHHMLDSLQQAAASNGNSEQSRQSQSQVASLQKELATAKAQVEKANQEASKAKQDLIFAQKSAGTKSTATVAKEDPKQVTELNRQLADLRKENDTLKTRLSQTTTTPSTAANPEAEQDYLSGKAAMDSKNLSGAIDKFKEAQLLEPNNSKYAIDYSIALAEDHQYAEAIDTLRRYLQRNPIDRDAYNQLGKIYLLNDQADAASQAFSRAMSISTLNNYATSLKKLGRTADAENIFKLALTLNPKDSEVLFNLGNLYNSENKLEQARNRYLEAIQIKPDFAEAHYNLGLIFSKLGDNPKAVTHLEKFLQLSPNARNAETIRAYVQKLKA